METYRVDCLSGSEVVETDQYEARDDIEALILFNLRGETTDCELWCGIRLVARVPNGGRPILASESPPARS